ncbi:uncharacterized protein LOC9642838 isoform X2 [Selaginella moellendorffii]|nr:uncharacterized protein LOC9642838 isoform X2 [Selaginella moellendorffii]|eukprot:XP_024534271.1 uncharacterized protein LOC9642838 isoform X2 [Selaginella moellendorffii]
MDRIINLPLRREEVSREEAKDRIMSINEKYKLEILEDIKTEPIKIYHIVEEHTFLAPSLTSFEIFQAMTGGIFVLIHTLKVPASLTGKPLSSSPSLELTGEVMSRDRCFSGFMELLGRRKSSSKRFCAQVPVLVDQHGCNGNADINFHHTCFTLGAYEFNNLLIGTYIIEAHHPRLDINVIGSNEVQLGWGMGEVDNIFMIPGYDVEGRVMSKGILVLGVQVFLRSSDVKDMECPQGPGRSPLSEQALCHATSDVEGRNFSPCWIFCWRTSY